MVNRALNKILKELKDTNSEVRVYHPSTSYLGKIDKIGIKTITIKPHLVWENIKMNERDFLDRARLEEEVGINLSKKYIVPTKLSKGYIENFIKATNYFSWKTIKNDKLREILFECYLLPTEEERELLEGESPQYFGSGAENKGKSKGSESDKEIGFRYSDKD
jgi:hypothetical protein